jgi:hypothetical protein
MRQSLTAQRAIHSMLPLQPIDCPELSAEQETAMAQDIADQFNTYVGEKFVEVLADMARDVLSDNNIDPDSPLGYDLVIDLINRIKVTAK